MEIWFIDDDKEEFEKIESQISDHHEVPINCTYLKPLDVVQKNAENDSTGRIQKPDVILVDYQLLNPDENGKALSMNGLSIATYLRLDHPDIPIILYSYRSIAKLVTIEKKIADTIFDEMIYKDDYVSFKNNVFDKILKIHEGYLQIKEVFKKWKEIEVNTQKQKIYEILYAPEDVYEDIDSILVWKDNSASTDWTPFKIASTIRKQLMTYPGLLYDSLYAATFLGISEKTFRKINYFFEDARYKGVFSSESNFWWKSKLMEIADTIMEGSELQIPYSHGFHKAWKRLEGEDLELSKCEVSNECPAECVCCIIKKPVMIKYTLDYPAAEILPPVLDEPRISFLAIQQNKINYMLLDRDSQEIFENYIRSLRSNGR